MDERAFFYLTGKRWGATLEPIDHLGLRPALFARFHDLSRLRYDYPLVLVDGAEPCSETLSGLVDALLREVAPRGITGERLRRGVLRLEREIRGAAAGGARERLVALWDSAVDRLARTEGEPFRADAAIARAALRVDGDVVDCDVDLPSRFLLHAWRATEERKATTVRREIDALVVRLADLVRADHLRSRTGRKPDDLRAGIGGPHRELFDFNVMAELLERPSGASALPESRRARIDETLATLHAQRFFGDGAAYGFVFDRVDSALAAFRDRQSDMAELVRAIAVAELEVEGRYDEDTHDEYFGSFDARALWPADLGIFPDYLVVLDARASDAAGRARVIEGLTSDAALKIVLSVDDALGIGAQLATSAMGLGDPFVVQCASSELQRMAPSVRAALEYRGPALISVFTGVGGAPGIPPYLVAAAATESRAFPSFVYDPSAGPDWAHRFSLTDARPQTEWPKHEFTYVDEDLRRVTEHLPFTVADFALCDARRYADFACVGRERRSDGLVALADWLTTEEHRSDAVPFVHAVDRDDRLRKLVVDERLVGLVRKSADAWRRLRELEARGRAPGVTTAPGAEVPAPPPPAPPAIEHADADGHASDDPYVDTVRCTSCNECTNLNGRMFKLNENKQAYIADASAGTYRELVEAAEACQVAIIHPGTPRNPKEPDLDELVQRAEQFR